MSYWCLYYIYFQCLFGRRGTAKKFQNRRRLSSMRSAGMAKSFKKVYFDMKLVRKAIYFVGPILSVVCRTRYHSGQFHRVFTLLSFLLAGSRDENLRYVNCRLILGGLASSGEWSSSYSFALFMTRYMGWVCKNTEYCRGIVSC